MLSGRVAADPLKKIHRPAWLLTRQRQTWWLSEPEAQHRARLAIPGCPWHPQGPHRGRGPGQRKFMNFEKGPLQLKGAGSNGFMKRALWRELVQRALHGHESFSGRSGPQAAKNLPAGGRSRGQNRGEPPPELEPRSQTGGFQATLFPPPGFHDRSSHGSGKPSRSANR